LADRDPAQLQHRAEQLSATLPPLLVAAEQVASVVAQGVHGRRRVGIGETFWQYRQYQQGDDAARIDWRQSARSMRLFIRENEWEAAQSVWLWRDTTPSMQYQSDWASTTKLERANVLLLALAALLLRGEERVGLLGFERSARSGRNVLGHVADLMLANQDAAARADGEMPGVPAIHNLPRHAQIVLIGDFLSPLDDINDVVRSYTGRGVRGHLLQILDPAEEDLPFEGRARFMGVESDGDITVGRVEGLRQDYHARVAGRRDALTAMAKAAGWTYAVHRTDAPPQMALLGLYGALSGTFVAQPYGH
jgi:uncharacterized protein (DUF58 family)